ncbi:MAG: HTH domain-containing protein [Microcoleaceae cyanobacterium]
MKTYKNSTDSTRQYTTSQEVIQIARPKTISVEVLERQWEDIPIDLEDFYQKRNETITQEDLAKQLGISTRTLQRRLSWIAASIPWFDPYGLGGSLDWFQRSVVERLHETFYIEAPRSHKKLAEQIHNVRLNYTPSQQELWIQKRSGFVSETAPSSNLLEPSTTGTAHQVA